MIEFNMNSVEGAFHNNRVHSTAIVGPDVKMGKDNYIGPYCVLEGDIEIGDRNYFQSHCSVGAPAQHRSYESDHPGKVVIGNDNTIREFSTIHRPIGKETRIENHCLVMAYAHVSHDTVLEDLVTLSNSVQLGGHTRVMQGATIALGAITHQYSVIGAYAMVGMGTIVTKRSIILPGRTYVGNPAREIGVNKVGLERNLVDMGALRRFEAAFWSLKGLAN